METALQQLDTPAQARSVPDQLHGNGVYANKKHDGNVSMVTSNFLCSTNARDFSRRTLAESRLARLSISRSTFEIIRGHKNKYVKLSSCLIECQY